MLVQVVAVSLVEALELDPRLVPGVSAAVRATLQLDVEEKMAWPVLVTVVRESSSGEFVDLTFVVVVVAVVLVIVLVAVIAVDFVAAVLAVMAAPGAGAE